MNDHWADYGRDHAHKPSSPVTEETSQSHIVVTWQ